MAPSLNSATLPYLFNFLHCFHLLGSIQLRPPSCWIGEHVYARAAKGREPA